MFTIKRQGRWADMLCPVKAKTADSFIPLRVAAGIARLGYNVPYNGKKRREAGEMQKPRISRKAPTAKTASPLTVHLDNESKRCLAQAGCLRHVTVSDYVRAVTVPQARREVHAARELVVALTPEEQLSFWNALSVTPELSPAQRRLGATMRDAS
jgi:uncharacterized protein (DUF1778 family)